MQISAFLGDCNGVKKVANGNGHDVEIQEESCEYLVIIVIRVII